MTLNSTSSLDGFRSNNGGGNYTSDIRAGNGSMVGSPSFELVSRGFVSFDIPSSLNGKTIEKVTLRMYQRSVSGTPYAGSNSLVVDHIDYSNSLEGADYDKSPIASNIRTLTSNAAVEWKDLDITSRFNNDLTNSRSRSQYRIKFSTETDGDGSEDFVYFDSANSGYNTNTPQLVVKYH